MISRRNWLVYGALLAIWVILIGWQGAEHLRVRRAARNDLRHHAQDVSSVLALVMRSQPRMWVLRSRIESALNELVVQGEVRSVELLNVSNEVVASAGPAIDVPKGELPGGEYWDDNARTVTLMNLENLGTNIVVDPSDRMAPRSGTNAPAQGGAAPDRPGPGRDFDPPPGGAPQAGPPPGPPPDGSPPPGDQGPPRDRPFGRGRPRLTPDQIREIRESRGVHGFVMVIPTDSLILFMRHDLWLRAFIVLLATVSVVGSGIAWRNLVTTSELQIRLVRASELNSHLREMNLAAAGLAHETRNPLNIIRGLAQMISRQTEASTEVRGKSHDIIEETDRVAAQLNEFINYSRPREVRRAATNLNAVVTEVVRALNFDLEEKKVQLQVEVEPMVIEADEQMLRQALFNLVLNATQAVPAGGAIRIRGSRDGAGAAIEIADNGPGVAPEHHAEIFKPYFTTQQKGTGLGLAVVQQIVLAHGWEIHCLDNEPVGAIFRIVHLKLAGRT